jgi:malate dehydrogenase (oxaloacetate-decarboxylating)(NADP+)
LKIVFIFLFVQVLHRIEALKKLIDLIMAENLNIKDLEALEYHKLNNRPGKISMSPTKPLVTQKDLSLAYSPGVAVPCKEIAEDVQKAYEYTAKGNLVAVISNGTAVLGLGNLGAAASKPVMEGKAVLFKRFADIDSFDLEVDTQNPDEFIDAVKHLSPSFGGINLEDIKAPECFIIEAKLKELMDIPVFHDDQHGTAIITAAGLINAAHITEKKIEDLKVVVNGAGAAGIACIELLKTLGVKHENVILCDTQGVVYRGRSEGMNQWKSAHAIDTNLRTLKEAFVGSDVFLGLSVKGAVTKEMVASMAPNPIIFAMANPDPEITPEEVKEVRDDAIIATGRSDYNNQVNNVMGFPYIFRGALDVQATTINEEMKIAAARALAELARQPVPDEVSQAYSGRKMQFGPEYIIPVPFDPRLITTVPLAVARAAIETKVARKVIIDFKKYKQELEGRLNPTSNSMSLIFERAHASPQKIIFAEGEEEEVVKAALLMKNNGYGKPILIGRDHKIDAILKNIGHSGNLEGIEILNAAKTPNLSKYIDFLYGRLQRRGYLYRDCARLVKTDRNIFASCILACGDADGLVTGFTKSYSAALDDVLKVFDPQENHTVFSYSIMITKEHNLIIADNTVHELPTPQELADITVQTAEIAKSLGYNPRVALLSFSNFGNPMREKAARIREAIQILDNKKVDFEYDGEMAPDVALNPLLLKLYPFCKLSAPANVLIMPALHTASVSTKLLQTLANGAFIGPILTGLNYPVQILQMGSCASDILNLAAFAAVNAIESKKS